MKFDKSTSRRYVLFFVAMLVIFGAIVGKLYSLQVVSSEAYQSKAGGQSVRTIRLTGKRGAITDADSVVLAQSQEIYNLTFLRNSGQSKAKDYHTFTQSILHTLEILARYGKDISVKFVIERDPDTTEFKFNFGKGVSDKVLAIREQQWRSNHGLTSLTRYKSAEQCYDKLYEIYQIKQFNVDEATAMKIMAVYSEMQMNIYNGRPVVIAKEIPYAAVSEISGRSIVLDGMDIQVAEKRIYPRSTLASQIIGYVGPIADSDNFQTDLKPLGYALNDIIGKDGIERSMENWLTPNILSRQGQKVMEVDSRGRLTRELSSEPPSDGNTVKLTLITPFQQQAERVIAKNVQNTRRVQEEKMMSDAWLEQTKLKREQRDFYEYPLKLAETGVMIVLDVNTGNVLAMAQYPTFDLNAIVSGGNEAIDILKDNRHVLRNYAIQSRAEPGSIYKMVTGLAALTSGRLSVTDRISDEGPFMRYTKKKEDAPTCWANKAIQRTHADQTIVEGLAHSCNYFFYELVYKMYGETGSNILYKYSAQLGLTSKTGIQLPGEARSIVGCQTSLYDPNAFIDEQETFQPMLVAASIKKHLRNIGSSYGITYDEDRLNKCVKRLMDMAVARHSDDWANAMRPILMEELNMTRDMVWLQAVVGDIWIYLNDIKWGGSLEVQMGIGQSITMLTPAAVARYLAAVGNGGTVYNLSIVDSIVSPEGEVLNRYQPSVFGHLEGVEQYLPYIKEGMKEVVDEGGTARRYFRTMKYRTETWAKTGTSQVTIGKIKLDLENNGWFIALAPFSTPAEIAVVVHIPNGFSGAETSMAARDFIDWYMEQRGTRSNEMPIVPGNELMP